MIGVSSGALIALKAALTLRSLRKLVIFEPPSALVTGMLAAQMGPAIFSHIPRWLLGPLTNAAMVGEDRRATGNDVTMRMLAPTLHYDFQLIAEMEGSLESVKAITAEVLLLGGSKSPAYLKASVDGLARVLPNTTRFEFDGLAHGATGNRDRGGAPERVAEKVGEFLG